MRRTMLRKSELFDVWWCTRSERSASYLTLRKGVSKLLQHGWACWNDCQASDFVQRERWRKRCTVSSPAVFGGICVVSRSVSILVRKCFVSAQGWPQHDVGISLVYNRYICPSSDWQRRYKMYDNRDSSKTMLYEISEPDPNSTPSQSSTIPCLQAPKSFIFIPLLVQCRYYSDALHPILCLHCRPHGRAIPESLSLISPGPWPSAQPQPSAATPARSYHSSDRNPPLPSLSARPGLRE